MAKKLPYKHGNGEDVVIIDDPKNPQIYFDPNDPSSRSQTNQSDKEGTDLNLIFARYEKTGLIPDIITGDMRKPVYGDFTIVPDFYTLQRTIARVNQSFDALPASTRERFKNDPQMLIDFLSDKANDGEAVKLGLKTEFEAFIFKDDAGNLINGTTWKALQQKKADDAAAAAAAAQPVNPAAKPGNPA